MKFSPPRNAPSWRAPAISPNEHVAPNAARWEWERRYPLETIKAACAAGLHTIELAKKHGGQGLSFSCKLRAFEEIAQARLRLRLRADQPSQRGARGLPATASRRMSRACCRA